MNRRRIVVVSLIAAFGAALARSQSSAPTPAAGQSGLNPSSANGSGMQLSTGTVTDYKAGQRIAIALDGGQQLALDLDQGVRVDGSVAVGQLAAIMWMTDNTGKQRVTSITAAPGPGDKGKSALEANYAGMSRTPPATYPARSLTPVSATTPTPRPADSKPRGGPTPSPTSPPRSR